MSETMMTSICCCCSFDAGAELVSGCCSGSYFCFYCCFEMNMMTDCLRNMTWPSSSYSYPCHDGGCTRSKTRRMSFDFYCYCCSSDGWIWI